MYALTRPITAALKNAPAFTTLAKIIIVKGKKIPVYILEISANFMQKQF